MFSFLVLFCVKTLTYFNIIISCFNIIRSRFDIIMSHINIIIGLLDILWCLYQLHRLMSINTFFLFYSLNFGFEGFLGTFMGSHY